MNHLFYTFFYFYIFLNKISHSFGSIFVQYFSMIISFLLIVDNNIRGFNNKFRFLEIP